MNKLIAFALLLLPSVGLACGGLFCNNTNPVNQNAERILFAPDGETMVMHVRITYQGPPSEFGWLLPVPKEVEYGLSSDQLFTQLDQNFGPQFRLRREFADNCNDVFRAAPQADSATGGALNESAGAEPSVQVLSREAVGPYDLALLLPDNIEVLREWLNENEFQIPDNVDATLQPYIEMGAAFVALKLLADADSGDVTPLRLAFPGDTPTIPIVPTSVAADPDMGIIVHVLGQSRAIPANYRHVSINEAAIDWLSQGSNYADVVSQAADEAGGKAFTTDFAGRHEGLIRLATIDQELLDTLSEVRDFRTGWPAVEALVQETRGDADIIQILTSVISVPEGSEIQPAQLAQCPRCIRNREGADEVGLDGEALVMKLTTLNEVRAELNSLLERLPYLTRLYGTMSPSEMTLDPTFDFNQDLEDIANVRVATLRIECPNGEIPDGNMGTITTESGFVINMEEGDNPNVIRRQNGETVRGMDVMAAAVISQQMSAGQPDVVEDNREQLMEDQGTNAEVTPDTMMSGTPTTNPAVMPRPAEPGNNPSTPDRPGANNESMSGQLEDGSSGGCACDASSGDSADIVFLSLLLPLLLRRRSRL